MTADIQGEHVAENDLSCARNQDLVTGGCPASRSRLSADATPSITRRSMLALGAAGLAGWMLNRRLPSVFAESKTRIQVQIAPLTLEVAPGHVIRTTAYNG